MKTKEEMVFVNVGYKWKSTRNFDIFNNLKILVLQPGVCNQC